MGFPKLFMLVEVNLKTNSKCPILWFETHCSSLTTKDTHYIENFGSDGLDPLTTICWMAFPIPSSLHNTQMTCQTLHNELKHPHGACLAIICTEKFTHSSLCPRPHLRSTPPRLTQLTKLNRKSYDRRYLTSMVGPKTMLLAVPTQLVPSRSLMLVSSNTIMQMKKYYWQWKQKAATFQ